VAAPIASTAAIGALETGARIAADAGVVSRSKFLAGSASYARRAGFAGQKDGIVFRGMSRAFTGRGKCFVLMLTVMFVRGVRGFGVTGSRLAQGFFVSGVGLGLSALARA